MERKSSKVKAPLPLKKVEFRQKNEILDKCIGRRYEAWRLRINMILRYIPLEKMDFRQKT